MNNLVSLDIIVLKRCLFDKRFFLVELGGAGTLIWGTDVDLIDLVASKLLVDQSQQPGSRADSNSIENQADSHNGVNQRVR
jgi:hypothetical protein